MSLLFFYLDIAVHDVVMIVLISFIGTIGFVDKDTDFDGFLGREVVFFAHRFLSKDFS